MKRLFIVFAAVVFFGFLFAIRNSIIDEVKDCKYTCERIHMCYDDWEGGIYCLCKDSSLGRIHRYNQVNRPEKK
jgi:hypothetical protein